MKRLRLRVNEIAWREISGEVVALDTDSSTYFGANESGAVLWRALAKGTTREELVADLAAAFGIDEARAGADVDAFLAELSTHGLIETWDE